MPVKDEPLPVPVPARRRFRHPLDFGGERTQRPTGRPLLGGGYLAPDGDGEMPGPPLWEQAARARGWWPR